jgi:septal ring factor EnvC (AmiA/AmiB activator)
MYVFKPSMTLFDAEKHPGNPMDKQDHSRPPKLETTLVQLDARVGRIESDVSELKSEMKDMRGLLIQVLQALAKIDGRMDEQRQTLNALIPTRLAAVGER